MYCVKCKSKTGTTKEEYFLSKNQKHMIKGKCSKCNAIKTRFISAAELKKGGFVFTIPALVGAAGALGSLAGGAATIANAVNTKKKDDKMIKEIIRHNKAMEGKGLFLGPPRKGKGLYLKPYKN